MSGKLLIVDHETTSRTKMKVRLKGAFYDVSGAKNLGEARAFLAVYSIYAVGFGSTASQPHWIS